MGCRYLINAGSVLMSDGTRHGVGSIVELDDDIAASMHGRVERVESEPEPAPEPEPEPEPVHVIGAPADPAEADTDVR